MNGEQENKSINGMRIGPKLKFYLFPLTRPTLKKRPYSKKIISIFSQEFFFFNFIVKVSNGAKINLDKLRELSNVNSVILANCLILLPIVGLYSKPCLKWPLKDIHNKSR